MGATSDDRLAGADERRAPVDVLVENHRAFLRFLERRLCRRDLAEDVLQEAFVRTAGRLDADPGRGPDSVVLPCHAQRRRRPAAAERERGARAGGAGGRAGGHRRAPAEIQAEVCACVKRLAATLKPEYAEALASVDVDGLPVKQYAETAGLSPSNAGVRLFRARAALRRRVADSCGTLRRARLPGLLVPPDGRRRSVMNDDVVRRRDRRHR